MFSPRKCLGATDPKGKGEVNILVSEEVWEALEAKAPTSHFAKTTICHELGHALIHVPILRRRLQVNNVLARMQRAKLRAFEDPEWQAWAFAGSILIPRTSLNLLEEEYGTISTDLVSAVFEVSSYIHTLFRLPGVYGEKHLGMPKVEALTDTYTLLICI